MDGLSTSIIPAAKSDFKLSNSNSPFFPGQRKDGQYSGGSALLQICETNRDREAAISNSKSVELNPNELDETKWQESSVCFS